MGQVVRTIRKQGAKNRDIRASIKEAMVVIEEMRVEAEAKRLREFHAAKEAKRLENLAKRKVA
jgi:hypothetical protein